jgi:hypothetical protein
MDVKKGGQKMEYYDIEKTEGNFSEKELINGIEGKNTKLSRPDAFRFFLKRNPKERLKVIESVIDNNEQPYKLRLMAINDLGETQTAENQKILLKKVDTKDDRLLIRVAKSLGKIGDAKALAELEKVKVNSSSLAFESLNFARQLISYRTRSNKELIKAPSPKNLLKVDEKKAVKLEMKMAYSRKIDPAIKQAQLQLPALKLSSQGVAQIHCRTDEFLLAFNESFQAQKDFQSLTKANAIPMIMLKKRECPDEYFLHHYFFTQPSDKKGELLLTGVRPGGTITYSGNVVIEKDSFSFSFKTVKNPYVAGLELSGQYDFKTQSFTFSKALSETTIDRELIPKKIPRKALAAG